MILHEVMRKKKLFSVFFLSLKMLLGLNINGNPINGNTGKKPKET